MSFLSCSLNEAKSRFFDRVAILTRLSKAERRVFNRVGATTRMYARRSMKAASKKKLKQLAILRKQQKRILSRSAKTYTPKTMAILKVLQSEIRALEKSIASRPGQPPKTRKGTIKQQLLYALDNFNAVVVGPILFAPKSGAPEALEEGKGNLAARPYMGPAKSAVEPQIVGMFRDAV